VAMFADTPLRAGARSAAAAAAVAAAIGLAVVLAGMFAWHRRAVGPWIGWMVSGVAFLVADMVLSLASTPSAARPELPVDPDLRVVAMGFGVLASASLAAGALVRAGDGHGAARRPRGLPVALTRAVPAATVLVAIVVLAWGHGVPGALIAGAAALLSLRVMRTLRAIERLLDERSHWALTDPLTGVRNRRTLEADARDFTARGARADERAALLLIDLDGFKAVNDTHGHAVGDQLLVDVAAAVIDTVRAGEPVYRIGGDEFAVLVSHDRPDAPRAVAERVRRAVAAATASRGLPEVTVSIGVAGLGDGGAAAALRAADAALYRAKAAGKDAVAGDGEPRTAGRGA